MLRSIFSLKNGIKRRVRQQFFRKAHSRSLKILLLRSMLICMSKNASKIKTKDRHATTNL